MKTFLRWLLTAFMVGSGVYHLAHPAPYVAMMPSALPAHLALVYVSGVAELAGGLGLLARRTRRVAAWGIVLLLLAVFPANVNMAVNDIPLDGRDLPSWALWARLPFQAVFVAWAGWFTRAERR